MEIPLKKPFRTVLTSGATSVWRRESFGAPGGREDAAREDRTARLGELFFGKRARQSEAAERKAMIDRNHELPVTHRLFANVLHDFINN